MSPRAATGSSPPPPTPPAPRRIARLMLVDNNAYDQRMYARIIQRSGLVDSFTQFTDAQRAADALLDPAQPMPNLILLDVNMPGMDGFEFLDAVTGTLGDEMCPVIVMLTTSLNPADERRARAFAAVHDFLNKPLTPALLDHISTLQA